MAGGGDGPAAAPARGARVALFPLPFQGHITPMLQLAGALHARGLAVTVLHTEINAPDPARHPAFTFVAVPDAIPPEGMSATTSGLAGILALNAGMEASGSVRNALASLLADADDEEEHRLACVIFDSCLTAVQKAAAGLGLPTLVLYTSSPASFRMFRSCDMLFHKGYLPATESNLHVLVKELQPLQVRDLFDPSKLPDEEMGPKIMNLTVEATANSSGVIFNTFEALEHDELEKIRGELAHNGIPPFVVGPLHKLIKSSNSDVGAETSLLNQDRGCIEWLDTQAPGTVLYVSFGSVVHVTQDEFVEMAWGLANSGKPFLWVVRRGLVLGVEKQELPLGFDSAMEGRGKVIEWAPQQEVLAHPAVGAFWTHNGWNSTLESIYEGVPMLSRPIFADQLPTARYVHDTWKIGILLEGVLKRGEVEKAIKRLLEEDEGLQIRGRAKVLKQKMRMCLESSGSSRQAVDKLVHHILSL